METLIRCRILRHLIWVSTVCICPTKRTLGLYGFRTGVTVSFFPSQFFPRERMGRPILSPGKKLTGQFFPPGKDLTSQFFPHPVSFFPPCYFFRKSLKGGGGGKNGPAQSFPTQQCRSTNNLVGLKT